MATNYSNTLTTNYGVITNVSTALERLNAVSDNIFTADDLYEMTNQSQERVYMTNFGDISDEANGRICFIRLDNATHKYSHKYMYLSLVKCENDTWQGFYIGTYDKLYDQLFNDTRFEDAIQKFNAVIQSIYDQLLDKEHWLEDDSLARLLSYLNAVYARCLRLSSTSPSVLTTSESGDSVCFNTRLLDRFGNFIYLACDKGSGIGKFRNIQVIISKSDYIRSGFRGERPSPVTFFADMNDVVFQGSVDEFDLEDTSHLSHLVEDSRMERLPEAYQNTSAVDMANSVKFSVEMALKMLVTDYRYIVPMYNIRNNEIQFLAPLYLKKEYSEVPEVALIISKNKETGLYTVNTMIDIGLAYSNSRVISTSTASWLERAVTNRKSAFK